MTRISQDPLLYQTGQAWLPSLKTLTKAPGPQVDAGRSSTPLRDFMSSPLSSSTLPPISNLALS